MKSKLAKVARIAGVVALILFYIVGHAWRSDMLAHMAAQERATKKPDVSVSVSEEGHVIRVEGLAAPGRPASPCSATLRFDVVQH